MLSEDSTDFFKEAPEEFWNKIFIQEKITQLKPRCFCVHEVKFYTNNTRFYVVSPNLIRITALVEILLCNSLSVLKKKKKYFSVTHIHAK